MRVGYAPAKRTVAKVKWRITLLIVLSPFIYFLGKILLSIFVAPSSGFLTIDSENYYSPNDSRVLTLHVDVGDKVESNVLLVTLDSDKLDFDIDDLKAKLSAQLGTFPKETLHGDFLANQVKEFQKNYKYQQKRFGDIHFLFNQGAATFAEQGVARNQLRLAKMQMNSAEFDYQQWQSNWKINQPKDEENRAKRELRAKLKLYEKAKSDLSVRANYPGTIKEVVVTQGQSTPKGEPLLVVAYPKKITVVTFISPKFLNRVQSGEIAKIKFPSGEIINGVVDFNPNVASRLPPSLASPILGRQQMIVVHLKPLGQVASAENVDGLPVEVYFSSPVKRFINRFIDIF